MSPWSLGLCTDEPTTELLDHRQIVSDRPALGDATVLESIREGGLALERAGREVVAAKTTARPFLFAHAKLHHIVTVGHDVRPDPACRVLATLGLQQKGARTLDARRRSGGQCVV